MNLNGEIQVVLSPHNLLMGGIVGVSRQVWAMKTREAAWDTPGKFGADNCVTGWQRNCEGAVAELAVAKWRDVFWDGAVGKLDSKDVGKLQIRSTGLRNGCLLLHRTDFDDDLFILVLSHQMPVFTLRGWILARDGKQEKFWRTDTDRPAFFVPQSELKSMASIDLNAMNRGLHVAG